MSFGKELLQSAKEALKIAKGKVAPGAINQHSQRSIHLDDMTEAEVDALAVELEASTKVD